MKLYPLKFENIYIDKIWGGRDFELFRENMPDGKVGETFDISSCENYVSIISNGEHSGKDLNSLIAELGTKLMGDDLPLKELPIMLRLVNPRDKLSVQVHPTDEYAQKKGMAAGKTEAWYVMETFEDPFMYIGTQGCTEEEFKRSIQTGEVEQYMRRHNVKKGDVFLLESGVVHAMGHDLIVVEIGQNSNTTYRIHDYSRGRELDVEDALNVVDLSIPVGRSKGLSVDCDGYSRMIYFVHPAFAWERYDIHSHMRMISDKKRFCAYTCVEGYGIIKYGDEKEYIKCGESVLMPAYLGEYEIQGNLKLLKSYVPDIQKAAQEMAQIIGL